MVVLAPFSHSSTESGLKTVAGEWSQPKACSCGVVTWDHRQSSAQRPGTSFPRACAPFPWPLFPFASNAVPAWPCSTVLTRANAKVSDLPGGPQPRTGTMKTQLHGLESGQTLRCGPSRAPHGVPQRLRLPLPWFFWERLPNKSCSCASLSQGLLLRNPP